MAAQPFIDPRYRKRRSHVGGSSPSRRSGARPMSQTGPKGTPGSSGVSSRPGGGSLPAASLPQPRSAGSPGRIQSDATSSKINKLPNDYASGVPLDSRQLADREAATPDASSKPSDSTAGNDAPTKKKEDSEETPQTNSKEAEKQDDKKKSGFRNWIKANKKRVATGGIAATLLGGGGFGSFMLQPILQGSVIIQEAKTLERSDALGQHNSSSTIKRAFKFARAFKNNSWGETRVGTVGSRIFGGMMDDLGRSGITFDLNKNGSIGKVNIDADKLKAKWPELDGMNPTEQKDFLRDKFGLSGDLGYNLQETTGPGKYAIDARYLDFKTTRALANSTISLAEDGKTPDAIKWRVAAKYWRLPNAFHPWERAKAKVSNKVSDVLSIRKERQQFEDEREKALTDNVEKAGQPAVDDATDKTSGVRATLVKALTITSVACIAYNIADDIPKINQSRVVEPAEVHANDIKASASQMESGDDFESWQPGEEFHNQIDKNGHGIFDSAAWNDLSTGGNKSGGYNMPAEIRYAFAASNTAAAVKDGINIALGGSGDILCSTGGQIAQGVLMVGLSFVGSPATSLAPKLVASWALKEGVSAAVAGVAMHFITNFVLDKTTAAKLAPDAFKGPLGGELLAFGARSAANTVGYSSGGIDLGNTKTTMYSEQYTAADQQDFMKKSFFARMFDPTSSQSLIGHMAIAYSNNDSLSALTTNFLNVGHNLGNMFGAFLPKASAAPQFDWGFGQVGIPDTMMNDPDLQNPWDNASNVAGILDSSNGSATIARALSCFGDTITKSPTDGKWEVQHTQPVNKQSDDYINAHCNQISAEQDPSKDWRRVIMFVNDSTTVDSMACAENDQDACDRVAGKSPAAATTASASSSGGPNTTSGDWFAPSDTMTCPVGTDGGVQDGYHNGTLVKIRICDVQGIKVNARIANNTNNLLNDAKAAGINFLGGSGAFRTMQDQIAARTRNHCPDIYTAPASSCNPPTALPGYSNHQMGEAIDFDQDGKLLSSNMSGFAWLKANAAKYGLSNLPSENWHWSVDGN